DQRELAEFEDVAFLNGPFAGADAVAVEVGAVGAAQVAEAPAALGRRHLGVLPADGAVVQADFGRLLPPNAQFRRRLPDPSLDEAGHAAQANVGSHAVPPCLRIIRATPFPGAR